MGILRWITDRVYGSDEKNSRPVDFNHLEHIDDIVFNFGDSETLRGWDILKPLFEETGFDMGFKDNLKVQEFSQDILIQFEIMGVVELVPQPVNFPVLECDFRLTPKYKRSNKLNTILNGKD